MNVEQEIIGILRTVLSLDARAHGLNAASPLLGQVAELDSLAVVSVLTAMEERFGIVIEDDDVDSRTFSTVGSLAAFVQGKLDQ